MRLAERGRRSARSKLKRNLDHDVDGNADRPDGGGLVRGGRHRIATRAGRIPRHVDPILRNCWRRRR